MAELATPQFWLAVVQIIVINILLSGDNAVVIALACRNLPSAQRKFGILWGVVGAVVLRIVLTFFAVSMLTLPYLKLVGAALLLWIGVKLIAEEDGSEPDVKTHDRLWAAVRTVIIADAVMSLDNVIGVAGAAKGSVTLLVLGLVISIPIVVLGSQLIMKLVDRMPWLVVAGGGLLGYIAGDIGSEDPAITPWTVTNLPQLHVIAPLLGAVLVIVLGLWLTRSHKRDAAA